MDWNQLTEKEKMQWYQEIWKKENPDFIKCDLVFDKTKKHPEGEWVLKVNRPNWTNGASVKYITDANFKWKKLNDKSFVNKQQLHVDIEIPFNKPKPKGKKYKSISCSVSYEFYESILNFCEFHNMTINQLLVILLRKVVPENGKEKI